MIRLRQYFRVKYSANRQFEDSLYFRMLTENLDNIYALFLELKSIFMNAVPNFFDKIWRKTFVLGVLFASSKNIFPTIWLKWGCIAGFFDGSDRFHARKTIHEKIDNLFIDFIDFIAIIGDVLHKNEKNVFDSVRIF